MSRVHKEGSTNRIDVQSSRGLLALSLEFVARPGISAEVEAQLPRAIAQTLQDVAGFAGSVVMVSDRESRLVNVITFWSGGDRARRCAENRRWVQALVKPYLDGCLRGRTHFAHGLQIALPGAGVAEYGDHTFAGEAEPAFAA